ncbi:DNA-processing protein DprA [Candidatus Haliotispira prima]|uniref:DNA-processing protein DprA n=1 Tax=Candidatus Haliotispira prima TaxID=3034016 RepID=A0ABY8MJL1_9SPIO|nr:DNA-processing protein DprA [Candidatus Haliotispira prima]
MPNNLFESEPVLTEQTAGKAVGASQEAPSEGADSLGTEHGKHKEPAEDHSKFLEVLLHQMPLKLQEGLVELLLPGAESLSGAETTKNVESPGAELSPGYLFFGRQVAQNSENHALYHAEEWRSRWLQSRAEQAGRSLDSCWQLLKDLGLNSHVKFRYFENCYRESQDCLERELRGELRIILRHRKEYPDALEALHRPPRLLFWRGRLPADNDATTAIIGSRRADSWAIQQAWQEALLLQKEYTAPNDLNELHCRPPVQAPAQAQVHWIISGLARGCDYAAHKGALEAGGPTMALLPGGFDHIYPKDHEGLARRIADEGGALVSEYVPQAAPLKWRFIRRDRLQAALAQQLLLIQSDLNGGSLHAVEAALKMGKPVYVLDGSERSWLPKNYPAQDAGKTGTETGAEAKTSDLSGTLCLYLSQRRFSREEALMSANYALLEKELAKPWRERHS